MGRRRKSSAGKGQKSNKNRKRWSPSYDKKAVAVVEDHDGDLRLRPCDKTRSRFLYDLAAGGPDVQAGDVVTLTEAPSKNRQTFTVDKVIGHKNSPGIHTTISLHEYGLRHEFAKAVKDEAKGVTVPAPGPKRDDLRHIPLITIDPVDARDFDDAVFAEPTADGGHHIIVAIADVAHYVRPGSALDKEALKRGNSIYFPDRVVPMLPEGLSNDVCSLRPNEDRACMGFHMWIDQDGQLTDYKPFRGLMRSRARLTYEQAQAAWDGNPDETTKPILNDVIKPLYHAFGALTQARDKRGTLSFDKKEQRIVANDNGVVVDVTSYDRLSSHKLIEEFMIMANIAAARALEDKGYPCVYRVHEEPTKEKRLERLKELLNHDGIPANDLKTAADFQKVLEQAKNYPDYSLISMMALMAQSKARYSTDNLGHFGLALDRYAHFTSPIRRDADLFVHRALIAAYDLGKGGLPEFQKSSLSDIADKISQAEVNSTYAERATRDRLTAKFLEASVGETFDGTILDVTDFGLFVRLDDTGAYGFMPLGLLGRGERDHFDFRKKSRTLKGRQSGKIYQTGDRMTVRLKQADGLSGSIVFEPPQKPAQDKAGNKSAPSPS